MDSIPRTEPVDVTVIINTCDQSPTVDLALHALFEQDFSGRWEIIVVDDGSTDTTSQLVATRADQSAIAVVYVRLPDRGMRWCHARNIGTRLSRGRVLLFLDGDMVPDREVVRLHSAHQAVEPCLLAGNRLWRNASLDLDHADGVDGQLRQLWTSAASTDAEYRRREATESDLRQHLLASAFPWRACFGCHVSVPATAGAEYDESMVGWGPADMEFACRLHHQHGLPVRFLPNARAWHVERPGAWHNPFRNPDVGGATEYVRQVCYMIEKHRGLNLIGVIDQGFDRLALDANDRWRIVSRGAGGDKQQTLEMALEWYARRKRSTVEPMV